MPTSNLEKSATSRRLFMGTAAVAAASYSRILGANERVHLGLIGCGDRGRGDMGNFIKTGNVDVAALCDVYAANIDRAKTAPAPRTPRPSATTASCWR